MHLRKPAESCILCLSCQELYHATLGPLYIITPLIQCLLVIAAIDKLQIFLKELVSRYVTTIQTFAFNLGQFCNIQKYKSTAIQTAGDFQANRQPYVHLQMETSTFIYAPVWLTLNSWKFHVNVDGLLYAFRVPTQHNAVYLDTHPSCFLTCCKLHQPEP